MALDTARAKKILIEYEADPSKAVDGVKKLAAEIRKAGAEQRAVQLIEKELQRETDKLAESIERAVRVEKQWADTARNLTQEMERVAASGSVLHGVTEKIGGTLGKVDLAAAAVGGVLGGVVVSAAGRAKDALFDLMGDAENYAKVQASLKYNIDAAVVASDHEVTKLEVMQSRMRLQVAEVNITDEAYARLVGSTMKLADAQSIDESEALEKVTLGLANMQEKALKSIGLDIDMKELKEDLAAALGKQADALTEMEIKQGLVNRVVELATEKAAKLAPEVTLATEELKKFGNVIKDNVIEFLDGFNRGLGEQIDKLKEAWNWYARVTDAAAKFLGVGGAPKDAGAKGPTFYGQPMSWYLQDVANQIPTKEKLKEKWGIDLGEGQQGWGIDLGEGKPKGGERFPDKPKGEGKKDPDKWKLNLDWSPQFTLGDTDIGGEFGKLGGAPGFFDDAMAQRLDLWQKSISSIAQYTRAMNDAARAEVRDAAAVRAANIEIAKQEIVVGTASSAISQLGVGLVQAGIAAIESGANFGESIFGMIKGIALSLGQSLLGQGIAAQVEAIAYSMTPWTAPLAAMAQAKATTFFTGAAPFLAGGIGMSIAGAAAGIGGGGASAGASSGASSGGGMYAGSAPSYGRSAPEDNRPINISLFLNDSTLPSQKIVITAQQLKRMRKAA